MHHLETLAYVANCRRRYETDGQGIIQDLPQSVYETVAATTGSSSQFEYGAIDTNFQVAIPVPANVAGFAGLDWSPIDEERDVHMGVLKTAAMLTDAKMQCMKKLPCSRFEFT